MNKLFSDYLDSVCVPIRSKALKRAARAELTTHLLEKYQDRIKDGFGEAAAIEATIGQMGEAQALGRRIVKANRSPRDMLILWGGILMLVVALLYGVGSKLAIFLDLDSFLIVAGVSIAISLLSTGRGLTAEKFWKNMRFASITAGFLTCLLTMIIILSTEYATKFEFLLSYSLLGLLYGCLLSIVSFLAAKWLAPPEAGFLSDLISG